MSEFECAASTNGHFILNDPIKLECGHLGCKRCLENLIGDSYFYCHKCGREHLNSYRNKEAEKTAVESLLIENFSKISQLVVDRFHSTLKHLNSK